MAIAKRYHLPDATVSDLERTIDFLRPNDILTNVGLARRVTMRTYPPDIRDLLSYYYPHSINYSL